MVTGDAVPTAEAVQRRPYHETVVSALERVIAGNGQPNIGHLAPVVWAGIKTAVDLLNVTDVPTDKMPTLVVELDRVAATAQMYGELITDAARRLETEHAKQTAATPAA